MDVYHTDHALKCQTITIIFTKIEIVYIVKRAHYLIKLYKAKLKTSRM